MRNRETRDIRGGWTTKKRIAHLSIFCNDAADQREEDAACPPPPKDAALKGSFGARRYPPMILARVLPPAELFRRRAGGQLILYVEPSIAYCHDHIKDVVQWLYLDAVIRQQSAPYRGQHRVPFARDRLSMALPKTSPILTQLVRPLQQPDGPPALKDD